MTNGIQRAFGLPAAISYVSHEFRDATLYEFVFCNSLLLLVAADWPIDA